MLKVILPVAASHPIKIPPISFYVLARVTYFHVSTLTIDKPVSC